MVASAVGIASGTRLSWSGVVPDRGISAAVIDGMGGYLGGSEAASMVATELAKAALDQTPERWDEWFSSLSIRIAVAGEAWGGASLHLLGHTLGTMLLIGLLVTAAWLALHQRVPSAAGWAVLATAGSLVGLMLYLPCPPLHPPTLPS